MIPFFRKIRKQLADDNMSLKYLRYAVGEIVLVVIGILIALQINNWNEHRKEQALYLTYLHRLKSDSENLLANLRITKALGNQMMKLTKYQLDFLNGDLTDIDPFTLAVSIEFTAGIISYSLNLPAYDELKSTGRLVLIESDSLKQDLAALQGYIFQRESDRAEWQAWVFKYRDLVRNVLVSEDRIRINDLWSIPVDSSLTQSMWSKANSKGNVSAEFELKTDADIFEEALFNIEGLPGLVTDIYISRTFTQAFLKKEELNTLQLIQLIHNEIDRLE